MSEPGWNHLEPSEHESNAEAQAENTGYGVDPEAVDAAREAAADPGYDVDESSDDGEDAEDDGPPGKSRVKSLLTGVGNGTLSGFQMVGRMNPRTRIGVASGLSVLALAGALVSRGTGRHAPKAELPPAGATAKADKDKDPKGKAPKAEPDPAKGTKDTVAEVNPPVTPPAEPLPAPPGDPLAEKPKPLNEAPDPETILTASTSTKGKNELDLPLPLANSGANEPALNSPAESPLPSVAMAGEPKDPKLPEAGKPAGPIPDPAAPPLAGGGATPKADAPAISPATPLPTIDDLDKLPPTPPPTAPAAAIPAVVALPLAGALAADALKAEPEKKDPSKESLPPPNPALPMPDPAAPPANTPPATAPANPPMIPPAVPVVEKAAEPAPPPQPGKGPEPKVEPQGPAPVASAPSPTEAAAPVSAPAAAPAPPPVDVAKAPTDLAGAPPKDLPKAVIDVGAGAGAAAIAGAAIAGTTAAVAATAIPQHDKASPDPKPESTEPAAIPIRNRKASQPRDLNITDDPRGDDSIALFDSGPDSSAVSPPASGSTAGDADRRFEVESSAPKTKGRIVQVEPETKADRVEVAYHQVKKQENFWTISREYYGSGRYYVALWAANKKAVPVMEELPVGQVIVVPDKGDLDPSLIEAVRAQAPSSAASKSTQTASTKGNRRTDVIPAAAPTRRSLKASGIDPINADDDDDNFAARGRSSGRSRTRESDIDDGLDRASDTRSNRDSDLPVHKVRPRETLRSIARDRLGDSKRASEILRLNRASIDDPSNLVPGQVIELPEDAKPGRR